MKENVALVEWIITHSGDTGRAEQCARHGSIREMTDREQLQALQDDTGLEFSRQWLSVLCARLT